MKSSRLNISPAIGQKWAEHAETLGRKYMRITGYVVLLTFCGGISTSLYFRNIYTPTLLGLIGGTGIAVIAAMVLQYFYKISNEAVGYTAYIGMATGISYLIATQGNTTESVLGQVPVFLTTGLVFFWKPKHSIICLLYNVLIGWLFLWLFSNEPVSTWVSWWAVLFPMGLGMVLITWFKYDSWRTNFLYSRQAEEINEELMRSHEVIYESQELLEMREEQMMASLNYAKRIQKAILPYDERMREAFPEYFALFKPKDIVSGDFYWMQKQGGRAFLALADCTGHGIPGGFMSMIGHSLLDSIVLEKKLSDPSEILLALATGIRRALQQDTNDNSDGMDISLCVFDFTTKELLFAGAKQSLVYFQKEEMHVVRGDKAYIGGDIQYVPEHFQVHRIPLEEPTVIYLSSDGYYDQFGGEHNKKMLSKNFRRLLQEIHNFPIQSQKERLEEYFEYWRSMSDEKQTDDVLVLGVKLG